MKFYPIYLDVVGRRCLVVGGGRVALRKVETLIEAGASVVVLAPVVTDELRLLAMTDRLQWVASEYDPAYLDGAVLAIAATGDRAVNTAVASDAAVRQIPANRADVADEGVFVTPAYVARGDLMLTVSTGGGSPTLAAVLREELEAAYGPEWAGLTSVIGALRDLLNARQPTKEGRKRVIRSILSSDVVRRAVRRGDLTEAEALARQCL